MKKAKPNPGCQAADCKCTLAIGPKDGRVIAKGASLLAIAGETVNGMSDLLRQVWANDRPEAKAKLQEVIAAGLADTKHLVDEILGKAIPAIELLHEKFEQAQRGELPTEVDLSPEAIETWRREHAQLMKGANNPLLALLGMMQPPEGAAAPDGSMLGLKPPRLGPADFGDENLN